MDSDATNYSVAKSGSGGPVIFAILGIVICGFGISWEIKANELGRWLVLPIILAGVAYLLGGIVMAMKRLEYNEDSISVVTGPFRRTVSLRDLVKVETRWGRGRTQTPYLILRDREGRRLKFNFITFEKGEEWKPLIMRAVIASGIQPDSLSREWLGHTEVA